MKHTLNMKPLDRKYEKFLGGPTQSLYDRLYVSLNPTHRLIFNNNCYRKLGKPPAVYLFFNREEDKIVIEPVHSYTLPAAFPVTKMVQSTSWRVNIAPFCNHHNIRLDTTERFISPNIEDGRLHICLRETVTVRQQRRKRKGAN